MAEDKRKKSEFFVYRVTPELKEEETPKNDEYILSPHYGKQQKVVNESMGYRRDPSLYDSIRPNAFLYKSLTREYNTKEKEETIDVENITEEKTIENTKTKDEEKFVEEEPSFYRGEYVEEIYNIDDLSFEELEESYEDKKDREEKPSLKEISQKQIVPKPKISTNPKYENLGGKRAPVVEIKAPKLSKYISPKVDHLERGSLKNGEDVALAEKQKEIINQTLSDHKIKATVENYIFGPVITLFFIKIAPGVNVEKINECSSNLKMYLEVESLRILTPIPGKAFAGIEVPKPKANTILLGDVIASKEFKNNTGRLPIVAGIDNYGSTLICDMTKMPHALVAGTTSSGKSVFLNVVIMSLIYRFSPNDVRFVLIDPKQIELSPYEGIPHLALPVIKDFEYFAGAINWVHEEMERRYTLCHEYDNASFTELNEILASQKKPKLPYIVVIIDELASWIDGISDTTNAQIGRLAEKARAAGIHIILAMQHPSSEILRGAIKANFDTRVAFKVANFTYSKMIIEKGGAETLQGRGDMLIKYDGQPIQRLRGALVDKPEIRQVVKYLKDNNKPNYALDLEELKQAPQIQQGNDEIRGSGINDERFAEVAYHIVRTKNASSNSLIREFSMGYNRINDILLDLEELGVVSAAIKGKQREVLVNEIELEQILSNNEIF